MKGHLRWIFLVFSIKLILFVFFSFEFYKNFSKDRIIGKLFISSGETVTYYSPIENLANGNGYSFEDLSASGEIAKYLPSTRRVPGILPIYYPLYKLLGKEAARTTIVLVQFLLSVISVYFLALISLDIFQSKTPFYITLFLYTISSFVSIFDHIGLAESLSTSFVIFAIFFLLKGLKKQQQCSIFLSGLFICWSIFLRPAVGVFFPVVLLFLVWYNTHNLFSYRATLKGLMLLSLTLIISVSGWSIRNYNATNQIIPLEDDVFKSMPYLYTPQVKAIRNLIAAWGGESARWQINSEGEWFFSKEMDPDNHSVFSSRHFTNHYNLDSLIRLREMFWLSQDHALPESEREVYKIKTSQTALFYTDNYKKEKPLCYFILSPLILTGKFLFIKTTNYLPFPPLNEMKLYHKLIKIFYIALYNLIMILGLVGLIISIFRKKAELIIISLCPVFYVIVMSLIFKSTEERYLVSLYPFLVLFSSLTINQILKLNFIRRIIPGIFL